MNRLHRQGVAEHERHVLGGTEIGNPIPREHALGHHHEIVAIRGNRLEERLGVRFHVPMDEYLPGRVEDAHVHRLHVEIDPAVVATLTVVESHSVLLLRAMRAVPCARAYSLSRWQGEG